ncbi:phospholipid-binding protein MlaC [Dechloromonas denitrificans]|uniref:MlaC/ttg2D family ABC transporter substrate-binding protein n=1 Tax=Dechloromonas denitrificans TaxID=281362 RepID=UPI001CF7ED2E|nr:ABC transporter substrate-binding protein [Dechloromonas denitrificans]UCV04448.1 ABC transporter substrate-binding protein [Dechloromonas denitrificans]UCV08782.1 ABC transporter substrate-binding protein [Dechloromonas denitrificans]
MMKKIFAFLFAAFAASSVVAQEAPDVLIRDVTEDVLEIIRRDKDIQGGNTQKAIELVDKKVLPHFNFQHMTALAVGKEWRKATPHQQQQLTAEFKTLLVRTYSNALTSYKNQKIVYKPFKMNAGDTDVLVRTEVLQPGSKPVQLDYSLEKQESGWKVYDVVVAGISLVTNYREQFTQEIRNGGVDGLIATVAAKNKSLETNLVKVEKK